jgi:hypothetical protein
MLMVSRKRPGRPPLPGPRYQCGRRKPTGDPRGHNVWQFIRKHGLRLGLDEKLRTEVGRLNYVGELTDRHCETAFTIARIYGEFERWHGQRRAAASPSYMQSFAGPRREEDLLDPLRDLSPEEEKVRDRLLQRIARSERRMTELAECFERLPASMVSSVRDRIERLCVMDETISSQELPMIAQMLTFIGSRIGTSRPQSTAVPPLPRSLPRHSATSSPRFTPRNEDVHREDWKAVVRSMPGAPDEALLEQKWAEYRARLDRGKLRRQKQRDDLQ